MAVIFCQPPQQRLVEADIEVTNLVLVSTDILNIKSNSDFLIGRLQSKVLTFTRAAKDTYCDIPVSIA